MFASPQLVARIDRAEGRLCAGIASVMEVQSPELRSVVIPVGGGVAVFVGPGSPTNKMIGVGFDGPPDERELDRVERVFADRGAPLQAEVSTLADPAWHACLARRGYEPRGFENLLGYPLASDAGPAPEPALPDGYSIERATTENLPTLTDVMVEGFGAPDMGGVGGDAIPPADELRRWFTLTMAVPGFEGVLVRADGIIVAGGILRLDGGVAQFCGAATRPEFRRRGLQSALLRWRLAHAHAKGCDVAVVTTQPASKSQQNAQRAGFQLLSARQLLVKG